MQTKTFYIAVQNESMESEGTVLHTQCGKFCNGLMYIIEQNFHINCTSMG